MTVTASDSAFSVLVVEDDMVARCEVEAMLRKYGKYKVTTAENGREALLLLEEAKATGHNYALILTEVSSFELIREVVAARTDVPPPVVVMSCKDNHESALQAFEAGAADYLIKPLRKNEVATLWQHIWRHSRLTGLAPAALSLPVFQAEKSFLGNDSGASTTGQEDSAFSASGLLGGTGASQHVEEETSSHVQAHEPRNSEVAQQVAPMVNMASVSIDSEHTHCTTTAVTAKYCQPTRPLASSAGPAIKHPQALLRALAEQSCSGMTRQQDPFQRQATDYREDVGAPLQLPHSGRSAFTAVTVFLPGQQRRHQHSVEHQAGLSPLSSLQRHNLLDNNERLASGKEQLPSLPANQVLFPDSVLQLICALSSSRPAVVPGLSPEAAGSLQLPACTDQPLAFATHRQVAVARYLLKRKSRCFKKTVRYESRKKLALSRPRVRGQFVKQSVAEAAGSPPALPSKACLTGSKRSRDCAI